jgi:hypothetical protein
MPVPKPSTLPQWATNASTTVNPSAGRKATGWIPGDKPAARHVNWLFNLIYQWIQWVNDLANQTWVWNGSHSFNAGLTSGGDIDASAHNITSATIHTTGIGTFDGGADMGSDKITNVANGAAASDAVNKGQMDAADSAEATARASADTTEATNRTNADNAIIARLGGAPGFMGQGTLSASGGTDFAVPGFGTLQTTEAAAGYWLAPRAGVLNDLAFSMVTDGTNQPTATVRKNDASPGSGLTAQLGAGGAGRKSATDTANAITVAMGDRIGIQITGSGAGAPPQDAYLSFVFVPN